MVEHAFKSYEKVLDGRLRKLVENDKMEYGFMPEKGTVNAAFILGRIIENLVIKREVVSYVC